MRWSGDRRRGGEIWSPQTGFGESHDGVRVDLRA